MAASENHEAPDVIRRLFTVRNGSLFFLAFCIGITLISVGITATLALVLNKDLQGKMGVLGQIFESVNAAFSGLGFIALVVTFRLQYDEFRLQRKELENQHSAMNKSQEQLRQSARCDIRGRHVELMRMSIGDEDLAEVWPDFRAGMSPRLKKQYAYANLIVQHQRMMHEVGFSDDADIRQLFHYLFTSPIMRNYWEDRMIARVVITSRGSRERDFEELIDQAYNETRPPEPPSTSRSTGADVIDLDSHRQSESDTA
jgi:hypothetical protein